ncbi:putative dehydrogenase and related protein [Candidatus Pelagibacter sp. IMCC9063]|uniref:Gfo/Idh/MocA family protein n=1 Tax=Pelagibacter sp. (strain IMCC9063) TaxID=1002672 RepID=UPI00020464C5|nr:Gfo/Idh/MocA family oxidoreductase [Candidatus Pelagibacter sp. IMCC9063]AEA80567.1 putative dehydrogenase and related protein [Candidatus Pelagibacter sp. IMCC9063]|tara:strand:- start:19635 stop:20588 length:954 start_codon:yes stop_codon:yes gene_type:complete
MQNILILGCGNIAGLNESKKSSSTFSHAKAISKNSFFNLKYCYDINKKKLLKFKSKWRVKNGYSNFNDVLKKKLDIDIVIITSPTHTHYELLKKSFKLNPKIIICEKPMCLNLKHGLEIAKKIPKRTKLFINYQRRLSNSYIELKKIISKEKYGKLRSISSTYNKGLFNNGSHLLDIFNYLLVRPSFEIAARPINDYKSNDLSYPFFLKKNAISISVNVANARDYYFFNLQFVFQKKIIEITENEKKINYFTPIKTRTYKNFTNVKMEKTKKNNDQFDMGLVYKHLKIFIKNNKHSFLTDIKEEIKNLTILEKITNN